jgi:DNA modification methylase
MTDLFGSVPSPIDQTLAFCSLANAALDRQPVSGWTHNFYRYPARFSPRFAAAAIAQFSSPGDLILDPYMGGGTAIVEGLVAGRHMVGNDLNSLAAFVTKAKTTRLDTAEVDAVRLWILHTIPRLSYRLPLSQVAHLIDLEKTKNLSLSRARFIKKATAAALESIVGLPSKNARNFAKCVLLRVGQWALDGRRRHTPLADFRRKLALTAEGMLGAISLLGEEVKRSGGRATIYNQDTSNLAHLQLFEHQRVTLVITSPPYPGVHVLYHRWQVDGRRETAAPYWITGCNDGRGASFYNFSDRRQADDYFRTSLRTLRAIRRVVQDGGYMVQMIAFNRPEDQLPRYLENMSLAGFSEVPAFGGDRIWRDVPHRKWHATLRARGHSAREVALVHRAV